MKFPKRLRYHGKGKPLATIYKRSGQSQPFRLYWRARIDGKPRSQFRDFATYSAAKRAGDQTVEDLAKHAQAARLSPGQVTDALGALEVLRGFFQATGKKVSLLVAASQWAGAAVKLGGTTGVEQAVDGFLSTVATVKREDLLAAVEQFIAERALKTQAAEGRRPQISPEHHYQTSLWLREFGRCFPGHCVCDLDKELLNAYMQKFPKVGAKTRNERRGVVKMFIRWATERDYLPVSHRLLEAPGLKPETADDTEIECFTAAELRSLLERASTCPPPPQEGEEPEADYRDLLPVLALAGLAGMRFREIMRLSWTDVFRVPGHIEVKAHKSKTRMRRLIEVCPALALWLEPYRGRTGPVWPKGSDMLHEDFGDLRRELEIPDRRNGLRHSFISAHFAAHSDENLTAAQAGNSPAVIHRCYKALMTKAEGQRWFAVAPQQPGNVIPLGAQQQQG